MSLLHPTAIIHPDAQIADDVEIGPYSIVEAGVKIAPGCRIASHVHLLNQVTLGPEVTIGPGAIVGANPQDLSFDPGCPSGVEIGAKCVLREYVTIHRGSKEGTLTRLGESNYLMTGAHLGHDCQLGNHNILANNCLLGGHVTIGNRCFLGGGAVFHQFVRLGDLVMAQGISGVSLDIPHYVIIQKVNFISGLNLVGLRRAGIGGPERTELKEAYRMIYNSPLRLEEALARAAEKEWLEPAHRFFEFFRQPSRKGYCVRTENS